MNPSVPTRCAFMVHRYLLTMGYIFIHWYTLFRIYFHTSKNSLWDIFSFIDISTSDLLYLSNITWSVCLCTLCRLEVIYSFYVKQKYNFEINFKTYFEIPIDQQKTSLYMSHLMCKLENKIYKYEYKSRISMCKRWIYGICGTA